MKNILLFLLLAMSETATAQPVYVGGNAKQITGVKGAFQVDSTLLLPFLKAQGDTTLLAIDNLGRTYRITRTMIGKWIGSGGGSQTIDQTLGFGNTTNKGLVFTPGGRDALGVTIRDFGVDVAALKASDGVGMLVFNAGTVETTYGPGFITLYNSSGNKLTTIRLRETGKTDSVAYLSDVRAAGGSGGGSRTFQQQNTFEGGHIETSNNTDLVLKRKGAFNDTAYIQMNNDGGSSSLLLGAGMPNFQQSSLSAKVGGILSRQQYGNDYAEQGVNYNVISNTLATGSTTVNYLNLQRDGLYTGKVPSTSKLLDSALYRQPDGMFVIGKINGGSGSAIKYPIDSIVKFGGTINNRALNFTRDIDNSATIFANSGSGTYNFLSSGDANSSTSFYQDQINLQFVSANKTTPLKSNSLAISNDAFLVEATAGLGIATKIGIPLVIRSDSLSTKRTIQAQNKDGIMAYLSDLTSLNATNLLSGTIPAARYGAGTIDVSKINASGGGSGKVLSYDGTWVTPSGGGGSPSLPLNEVAFGTGSGISSSPQLKIIPSATGALLEMYNSNPVGFSGIQLNDATNSGFVTFLGYGNSDDAFRFNTNGKPINFKISNVDALSIASNRFVGIGTSGPQSELDVNGTILSSKTTFTLPTDGDAGVGGLRFSFNASPSNLYGFGMGSFDGGGRVPIWYSTGVSNGGDHIFYTGGYERMRIGFNGITKFTGSIESNAVAYPNVLLPAAPASGCITYASGDHLFVICAGESSPTQIH